MPRELSLTHDMFTIVDDEDYAMTALHHWSAIPNHHGNWYAGRWIRIKGKSKLIFLHRILLNAPPGKQVDHVDRNGLNNVHNNLRLCSHSQNCRNSKTRRDNSSGYKGVHQDIRTYKWITQIQIDGKTTHIGCFANIQDAALAYDKAAIKYYGTFAKTNF